MLLNILLSIVLIPNLLINQVGLDSFLNLSSANNKIEGPTRVYTDILDIKISAQSAFAVDAKSGEILYQKNSSEVRPIASITKLMTALIFLDYNPGWQKEFSTISSDRRNGNIVHLNPGEILTIQNLFNTALIASDNDAIIALTRATGLTEEQFVEKMNAKAEKLGLLNTKFVEPTGLEIGNQANTFDVANLLEVALQKEEIKRVTGIDYYEFEVLNKERTKTRLVKITNTDRLLNSYLNVIGGKTGSLEEAGYCLAVKIKGEENQEVIIVVLGSQSNYDRFQDIKAIADFIFTNFNWQNNI
jgi:D-alanyl-D-alanine carboxypeptidase